MQMESIATDRERRIAVARISELMNNIEPNSPEGDELDRLATLVDAYESKHHVIDKPSPAAALEFRMDQERLNNVDLEGLAANPAPIPDVLSGERS